VQLERPHFKKILVTGGAGFIGCHFVRMIIQDKLDFTTDEIVVVDALTYAANLSSIQTFIDSREITFVHGNITDFQLMKDLTKRTDLIVNFAAESHVDRSISNSQDFILSNVLGVDTLLHAMRLNDSKFFLQVSTDEVYGSISSGSWNESFPLQPNSPYSASKASAELITLSHWRTHEVDVRITRCCNNYGPFQHQEKFIPTCIRSLLSNEKIPIYGLGNQIREWIHVEDHCMGIGLVIAKGKAGETYNIGSGQEVANLELAQTIASIVGASNRSIEYVQDRKGHDFRYSLDFSKISTMGYLPQRNWKEELPNLISWYKENTED
jgi:dTDP-glucose 4,6-dehydratase